MNNRSTSDKLVIFGSIAALVVTVVLCMFVANLITNLSSAFIPLAAGLILLLGNRAGVLELVRTRQPSPAVLNALVGVALVLVGLGTTIFGGTALRVIFYVPGILLLLLALPIALSKPAMYSTYRGWASSAMGMFRRVRGGVTPQPPGSFQQPNQTINLDPTAFNSTKDRHQR